MKEIFKPLSHPLIQDGYMLSCNGYIKSSLNDSIKPYYPSYHSSNGYDYESFVLKDGTLQLFPIDDLLCYTFIPIPDELINKRIKVNHIDGNNRNNCIDNLEWIEDVEEWKSLDNLYSNIRNGYVVSNFGRIKNNNTGKVLSQLNRNGYLSVSILRNGYQINTHRLVALAFYNKPKESTYVVNHIDSNRHNNYLKNLEWVSQKENNEHAIIVGLGYTMKRGEDNILAKVSESEVREICKTLIEKCRNSRVTYETLIKKFPNITRDIVRDINRKRTWKWVSDEYF